VSLDSIKVEGKDCPTPLSKTFNIKVEEHSVSTFVVGIQKKELVGLKVRCSVFENRLVK